MRSIAKRAGMILVAALAALAVAGGAWAVSARGGFSSLFAGEEDASVMTTSVVQTSGVDYDIIPGKSTKLDPSVVVDSRVDSYVYADIVDTTYNADTGASLVTYEIADGWTRLKDSDGVSDYTYTDNDGNAVAVYYRAREASESQSAYRLIKNDTITYSAGLGNEDMPEDGRIIRVQSHVVQQEGFTSALNAYVGNMIQGLAVKFPNTDKYLYRVGNLNAVKLDSLFYTTGDMEVDSSAFKLTVTDITPDMATGEPNGAVLYTTEAASAPNAFSPEKAYADDASSSLLATVTPNATDWKETTLKFTGTGVVKVEVANGDRTPVTLLLEVIDAYNVTSYAELNSNKAKNTVLLNDIEIDEGAQIAFSGVALYGNGFTFDVRKGKYVKDSRGLPSRYVISLSSASVDNIQITGAVYKEFGVTETTDDYNNAAVYVGGECAISNSYISNCAAPVRVNTAATCRIVNTTLAGGVFANLDIRDGHIVLEDVTTINQIANNDVADDGTKVLGCGIVTFYENVKDTTRIEIIGKLTQYNYACESDISYIRVSRMQTAFRQLFTSSFSAYQYVDSGIKWANAGIITLSRNIGAGNIVTDEFDSQIRDAYVGQAMSSGYVYAPRGRASQMVSEYSSEMQASIVPAFTFAPIADQEEARHYSMYNSALGQMQIGFEEESTEGYTWNPNVASAVKNGHDLAVQVTMDGVDYTGSSITFTEPGTYDVIYSYDDPYNYTASGGSRALHYTVTQRVVVVTVEPEARHADITFKTPNGTTYGADGGNGVRVEVSASGKKYVMPDVQSNTTGQVLSTTIDGVKVYCPYQEVEFKDNSSDFNYLYPLFKCITITDYEDQTPITIANSSTTSQPARWAHVTQDNGFSAGSSKTGGILKQNNTLYYSSGAIGADRNEGSLYAEFSYTDLLGETYYYCIYYHKAAHTCPSTSCLVPGTLVTLADGTHKPVEEIVQGDTIATYSFFDGSISSEPVIVIEKDHSQCANQLTVKLSNGQAVSVIEGQSFFDMDAREYFTLDTSNYQDHIGRSIMVADGNDVSRAAIDSVDYEVISTDYYELITAHDFNYFANDALTVTPLMFNTNTFEVNEGYRYDRVKMLHDIARYGLFTPADFKDYVDEEEFDVLGGSYFKVALGKELISWEYIYSTLDYYVANFQQK